MPSGDYFSSADQAGNTVRGTRHCAGMAFWYTVTAEGKRLSLNG